MTPRRGRGLIIAAPASGSGKTVITLGLLRALKNKGTDIGSLKIGPDYIDPAFHSYATGLPCRNIDIWSMRPETLHQQISSIGTALMIAEGVMGLFDGAADGTGSTADAAALLGWPVVLVIDVKGQSASAAAVVEGFARHREDVTVGGVVFNRVSGERHQRMLEAAIAPTGIPCLGCVPRSSELDLPSRHLGLVQAREHSDVHSWVARVAAIVGNAVDVDRLANLAAAPPPATPKPALASLCSLGLHIAVAQDDAFAFAYPHILEGWKSAGASITFFSPLADDPVPTAAEGVYLPGGYPELHAPVLDKNQTFLRSLRDAASRGAAIYGECGGFMVLGETLTDENGEVHKMAGLLPVHTSFAERKLHLGYRTMVTQQASALGPAGQSFKGHEFHYASLSQTSAAPLFRSADALGETSSLVGCVQGTVCGSFLHIIDAS